MYGTEISTNRTPKASFMEIALWSVFLYTEIETHVLIKSYNQYRRFDLTRLTSGPQCYLFPVDFLNRQYQLPAVLESMPYFYQHYPTSCRSCLVSRATSSRCR